MSNESEKRVVHPYIRGRALHGKGIVWATSFHVSSFYSHMSLGMPMVPHVQDSTIFAVSSF